MIYTNEVQIHIKQDPSYPWLNIAKYEFLDRLYSGYAVINLTVLEEFISDNLCTFLGTPREELGKTIEDLKRFVHPDDFDYFEKMTHKLILREIDSFSCLKRLRSNDGEFHDFRVACTWDYNNNIVSIFELIH